MRRHIETSESKQQIQALEKALDRHNKTLRWFFDHYIAPGEKLDWESFIFKYVYLSDTNGFYSKINQFLKECMKTPRRKPIGAITTELFNKKDKNEQRDRV